MVKLIREDVKDDKLDKSFVNFYVKLENGNRVRVKNVFKDDFVKLLLIAEKE